jgi:hypothetical protein
MGFMLALGGVTDSEQLASMRTAPTQPNSRRTRILEYATYLLTVQASKAADAPTLPPTTYFLSEHPNPQGGLGGS